MKHATLFITLILSATLSCTTPKQVRKDSAPKLSRDELVLNAVLVHFLADHQKDAWTLDGAEAKVLLHIRNPEKTGILDQTEGDIGDRKLDPELLQALRDRNAGSGWNATPFSYKKFRLDKRVTIKDIWAGQKDSLDSWDRSKGYKGYFEAYAPGFSKNGQRAVVRAWVGPSPHGGTVTYALELRNDEWTVLWREYAFYA